MAEVTIDGRQFAVPDRARAHQAEALGAFASHIHEPRGQLLMACGSGKTLVSLWLAELKVRSQGAQRIILLFPNLHLVGQTLQDIYIDQCTYPSTYRSVYQPIGLSSYRS